MVLLKHNHPKSWNLLRSLSRCFDIPCFCAGDFNKILKSHEKLGGRIRPFKQMQDFWDVIDEAGFADSG